ncbi:MAG: glycerate kinase [Thioalkalivibrio sp.]
MTRPFTALAESKLPLELLRAGLAAVDGASVVRRALTAQSPPGPCHVIALGKAAAAMALGARSVLDERLERALVVSRPGHLDEALCGDLRVRCLEADHPVPGRRSLAAGKALMGFIDATPGEQCLLFLISGGTSSLVEVPVAGVDADRLARLNDWLLGAGLDIGAMNRIRSALSAIKGGRLAQRLAGRPVQGLLISDVPGDDPAVIGSGLLCAGAQQASWPCLPPELDWVASHTQPPLTPEQVPRFSLKVVASLEQACAAVETAALERGLPVSRHGEFLRGEAGSRGEALARFLMQAGPGVHIWGGETHVHLPANPGRGGRNQHLALAAARVLAGHEGVRLLAVGTDGSDGNSPDAGALVDGRTVARGEATGLDAGACLARADSGRFLAEAGALVHTGPTGTNVMDLVIGVVGEGAGE